jgi:hypothetical protein
VVGLWGRWVSWAAFSIASSILRRLCSNLALPGIELMYQITMVYNLDAVRRVSLAAPQEMPINALLPVSFRRHTSNSLDILYALVGLARKVDQDTLIPDYSKPVEVLFKELVQRLVYTDQNFDILSCSKDYQLIDLLAGSQTGLHSLKGLSIKSFRTPWSKGTLHWELYIQ